VIVVGHVSGIDESEKHLVIHRTAKAEKDGYDRPLHCAALGLLAARAKGIGLEHAVVLARHKDWEPGAKTDAGNDVQPGHVTKVLLAEGIEPVERLKRLCELAQQAIAGPCGLFGLRDSEPTKRASDFEAYVDAKNWAIGQAAYARSTEAIVYGMSPVFEQIFAPKSRELIFLDGFYDCARLKGRRGVSEFTLQ